MKKITLTLTLALALFSCEKENVTPTTQTTQPTTTLDCDCDRVVSSNSFNLAGGGSFGYWSTVNDCTNQTVNGQWSSSNGETRPVVGTCK
jgi:hypothetical protein